jgi:hypothetical protein
MPYGQALRTWACTDTRMWPSAQHAAWDPGAQCGIGCAGARRWHAAGRGARQKMVCAQTKSANAGARPATPCAASSFAQAGARRCQSFAMRCRSSLPRSTAHRVRQPRAPGAVAPGGGCALVRAAGSGGLRPQRRLARARECWRDWLTAPATKQQGATRRHVKACSVKHCMQPTGKRILMAGAAACRHASAPHESCRGGQPSWHYRTATSMLGCEALHHGLVYNSLNLPLPEFRLILLGVACYFYNGLERVAAQAPTRTSGRAPDGSVQAGAGQLVKLHIAVRERRADARRQRREPRRPRRVSPPHPLHQLRSPN